MTQFKPGEKVKYTGGLGYDVLEILEPGDISSIVSDGKGGEPRIFNSFLSPISSDRVNLKIVLISGTVVVVPTTRQLAEASLDAFTFGGHVETDEEVDWTVDFDQVAFLGIEEL